MADLDVDLPDVPALRVIEPPPGGLARLRAALDAEPRRERRRRWLLAATAAAAAAIVVVLVAPPRRREPPVLMVVNPPAPVAPLADPVIGGEGVQFYWVASRPAAP
jgi:hypothetical protein